MIATLTSEGQVTVPESVREQLGIGPGSKIDFSVTPEGRLEVEVVKGSAWDLKGVLPKPGGELAGENQGGSWKDLIGILPRPERPVTVEEMNEAIARAACGE